MNVKQSQSINKINNFDFLRFFAATLVVLSHAFPISNSNNSEILYVITHGQFTFGSIAVKIFFIISGFLIAKSWDRTKDAVEFLRKRFLRIFPALIVVVVLSTFVLGAIFTTYTLKDYFTNKQTYRYLQSISLIKLQYTLPGVFENNIYKDTINGSLWTLVYEFACYIIIIFLGLARMLNKKIIIPLFLIIYSISFSNILHTSNMSMLLTYFLVGTVVYLVKDKIRFNVINAIICSVLIIVASELRVLLIVSPLLIAYLVFYIAFCKNIKLYNFSKYGDFSYGIYIYAFPIQQIIVHLFGGRMEWYINFIISFPLILIFSYISWHMIENPCMKLKSISISNQQTASTSLHPFIGRKPRV